MVPPMSHAERNVLLGVLFFATALCAAQWVFARQSADDKQRWEYLAARTWTPHAKIGRWLDRPGGRQRDSNIDFHLAV